MKMKIEEEDSVVVRQVEADVALQVIYCLKPSNTGCAVPSDRFKRLGLLQTVTDAG